MGKGANWESERKNAGGLLVHEPSQFLVPDWGANFLWYLFKNDLKQSKNWHDSHFNLAADSSYDMFYFLIQFAQHGNEARATSLG